MAEDLLSLKWNNHKPAFFHLLKTLREKGRHTDVTLTCGSQFFPAHRLVLVACSQFFSEVLEHTGCGRPVIVLKDVCAGEMEALLDYMYLGEVDVPQASLPGLIRAAESLKIKGLAVPDTDPNITTAATPTPITTTTTTAATTTTGNQEPPPPTTTTTTTTTTDDLHTTETQDRPTKRRKVTESHSDHDLTSELQVQITEVKTEAVELSETTFDPSDLEMVPGQGQLQHFLSEEEGHAFEVMAGMSGVHGEGHDGSTNESTTLFPSSHLIGPQIQEDSQLAYEKEDEEEEERRRRPRGEAEEDKEAVMVVEGNVTIPQNYATTQMTRHFPKESDTPHITPTSSTDIYQAMSSSSSAEIPPNTAIGKCVPQNQYSWGLKYGLNLDSISVDISHSLAGGRSNNSRGMNTACNSTNPENLTETRGNAREPGGNGCAPGNQTSGPGYACPFCERLDMYESKYLRHLRVHTGEKPYVCPVCDFRANTKHSVQRHIRMRHNNNKT